jgi:hypothetical protein
LYDHHQRFAGPGRRLAEGVNMLVDRTGTAFGEVARVIADIRRKQRTTDYLRALPLALE